MRFDDRLKTAIMQPVVDTHDRVVRWRQVVDLLSYLPEDHDEAIADAGFALVEREVPVVPEQVRAAAARNIASRPAVFRMVALFARDKLSVAAPVLAAANLGANEWARISRDCSPEVASFIQALVRNGEAPRELPQQAEPGPILQTGPPEAIPADEPPSISQMVARIEQLRSRRGEEEGTGRKAVETPAHDERTAGRADRRPALARPVEPGGSMFRWESDAVGQIAWVDGVPRGAFVGGSLLALAPDDKVSRALQAREPFHAATVHVDVLAAQGEWQLSGLPAFSPRDGRFLGYRGVAQRRDEGRASLPAGGKSTGAKRLSTPRDVDALRETIHEIKTPLNAIIGFAEIIDGQYLGPAHRNYRERAAQIVAQARTLLEAIQDMEAAAQLRGGSDAEVVSRLGEFFPGLASDLQQRAERQDVVLSIIPLSRDIQFTLNVELARRLVKRFVDALIDAAAAGERLVVDISDADGFCVIGVTRPAATTGVSEALLTSTAYSAGDGDQILLGLGFALRLVRGLARLVDGDIEIQPNRLLLRIPSR